jgi:hypothetical protein
VYSLNRDKTEVKAVDLCFTKSIYAEDKVTKSILENKGGEDLI